MNLRTEVDKSATEIIKGFDLKLYQGENLSVARKRITAIAKILEKAGLFNTDSVKQVLVGLTTSSLPSFNIIFEQIMSPINQTTHTVTTGGGTPLNQIDQFFHDANTEYLELYLTNKWPAKADVSSFTSCGG